MLDLAKHIICTKKKIFNPAEVNHSYKIAVAVSPIMPAFPLPPKEILVGRMHFTFICNHVPPLN